MDFTIIANGIHYMLRPNTERAKAWVWDHMPNPDRLSDAIFVDNLTFKYTIKQLEAANMSFHYDQ